MPTATKKFFRYWTLDGAEYDFNTPVTNNITLVAQYFAAITITYDSNGGTTYPSVDIKTGSPAPDPGTPSKTGHTFKYWALPDGTKYDFTSPLTGDTTLKAIYERQNRTVTFDYNDDGNTASSTVPVLYADPVTEPADPTYVGHDFNGWYLNDSLYNFNSSVTNNITLTAHWSIKHLTVTFDPNNGESTRSVTVDYGATTVTPSEPSKDGYRFVCWQLDDSAYNFNTPVTSDITLVAQYIKQIKVTFKNHDDSIFNTQTIDTGSVPVDPGIPNKDGFTFKGWAFEGGERYDLTSPLINDTTLSPIYTIIQYTVTFDPDNGEPQTQETVDRGSLVSAPEEPFKEHYEFDGWYINDIPYDFTLPVMEDITLTAHWHILSYTITFDSVGGTRITPQLRHYMDTATKPEDPTKDDHTFLGWFLDGELYDFSTPVTDHVLLEAHWKHNGRTVTFIYADEVTPDQIVNVEYAAILTEIPEPTREHYIFDGGYDNGVLFDSAQPITENMTLIAHWSPKKYTVTFKYNNEKDADMSVQVTYLDTVDQPASPTKTGHTFKNWALNDKPFEFSTPISQDITLFATYDPITFTVTLKLNNGEEDKLITVNYGDTIQNLADPVYTGHQFSGWYLKDDLYDIHTPIMQDIILEAHWKDMPMIKVTFIGNGGTPAETVQYISINSIPSLPPTPTLDKHLFNAWALSSNSMDIYNFTTPLTIDTTFYAQWKPYYTITFNSNGGTEEYDPVHVLSGETTYLPSPKRSGYTFKGWYEDSTQLTSKTIIEKDWNVTAKWNKKSSNKSDKEDKKEESSKVTTVTQTVTVPAPTSPPQFILLPHSPETGEESNKKAIYCILISIGLLGLAAILHKYFNRS